MTHPRLHSLILTLAFLLFTPLALSYGINCDDPSGKKYCHQFTAGSKYDQTHLLTALNDTAPNSVWKNGQNIACLPGGIFNGLDGALCVWVWNTQNTTTGAEVIQLAQQIPQHGCGLCGSVPIVPGTNDVDTGEVTIGFSWNEGGCDGACNAAGGSSYAPGNFVPSSGLDTAAQNPADSNAGKARRFLV